jgi:hypothetical protein
MKWVKASERRPEKNDATSVDSYDTVIARRRSLLCKKKWVTSRHRIEDLPNDYEWLEGWNETVEQRQPKPW